MGANPFPKGLKGLLLGCPKANMMGGLGLGEVRGGLQGQGPHRCRAPLDFAPKFLLRVELLEGETWPTQHTACTEAEPFHVPSSGLAAQALPSAVRHGGVLEIGTYWGTSCLRLAHAVGSVTSLELDPVHVAVARTLSRGKTGGAWCYRGWSCDVLPALLGGRYVLFSAVLEGAAILDLDFRLCHGQRCGAPCNEAECQSHLLQPAHTPRTMLEGWWGHCLPAVNWRFR